MPERFLAELQATIEHAIPMCAMMGIEVDSYGQHGLTLRGPLKRNTNHQATAFAGSLNALCTMAGWGYVFLLHRLHGMVGNIVICRSSIKYLKPVASDPIYACCHHVGDRQRDYFLEMFRAKGQSKIDIRVEIMSAEVTAVAFSGAYVITERPAGKPTSDVARKASRTLDRSPGEPRRTAPRHADPPQHP